MNRRGSHEFWRNLSVLSVQRNWKAAILRKNGRKVATTKSWSNEHVSGHATMQGHVLSVLLIFGRRLRSALSVTPNCQGSQLPSISSQWQSGFVRIFLAAQQTVMLNKSFLRVMASGCCTSENLLHERLGWKMVWSSWQPLGGWVFITGMLEEGRWSINLWASPVF